MYTKKFFLLVLILGTLTLSSCSKDDVIDVSNSIQSLTTTHNQGGYLIFKDQKSFNNCIEEIKQEESKHQSLTRSYIASYTSIPKNFKSIASLKDKNLHPTRGVNTNQGTNDETDEDMTLDEFNIMKAEDILIDPVLTNVMDTTLRIQVGDTLYKVTEKGTFYTNETNIQYLDKVIKQYYNSPKLEYKGSQSIALDYGIYFKKSSNNSQTTNAEFIESNPSISKTRSTETDLGINLQQNYNTEDFKWKNHSIWQKFWDTTLGKSVSRERNFDSKHRIQVEVFSVNYRFYTSAGIKVRMQKRKKFLFVKYWVSDTCEDMAIGFNMITGTLKFNNPTSYSSITPSNSIRWNEFTSTFDEYESRFLYQRLYDSNVVKDWINPIFDKLYIILPNIKVKNPFNSNKYILEFPSTSTLQSMYNAPYKYMSDALSKINGHIWSPLEGKIKPEDPRIAYLVWGSNEESFTKSKPFITGVKRYGSTSTKVVRFNQSFGFSYIGIIKPFLPSEFKIEYFDGFGAVKYNGKWLGIRFIGNDDIW